MAVQERLEPDRKSVTIDYDVIVIGAGISGMYQLHCLRHLGLNVQVFEAGTGVGGTWYWNRYPGARFDSESYSYGYSFSQDLLDEWDWSEHFAPQTETEQYLNYFADKFDLRRNIEFSSRVTAAVYDDASSTWEITIADDRRFRGRFLVAAVGPLSAPTMPRFDGIDEFRGPSFHTGLWPK
ncbi:MAG: flavin-containing monooxygenase, partial [Hyphomicrobiaceae bacterium]